MTAKRPILPPPESPKLPAHVASRVGYDTSTRAECRLRVTNDDWPAVAVRFKDLKRQVPDIRLLALDDAIYLGSECRDTERWLAAALGVVPDRDREDAPAEDPDRNLGGRPRGRRNNRYPFHELVNVGDCFVIPGELTYAERAGVSALCGLRTKRSSDDTGVAKRFVSHQTPAGLVVMLVWSSRHSYSRVVPLGGL